MGRIKAPFRDLTREKWQNLAIAALVVFYAAQIALDLAWGNLFGRFATDFASFWSAGFIANHEGYAAVYNLDLMGRIQHPLLPTIPSSPYVFHPIPTPYLPVFIVPFQLLALVPPVPAAYVWEILNFLGTIAYLWFFSSKIGVRSPRGHLIALMMVSAPVFLNLFAGQVNLLLAISAGEYLRAAIAGRRFQSGLWLGGLLLKPQCLILIVPALLLQRSLKSILGQCASSAAILGASLLLGGAESLSKLAQLWLGYAAGLPTNDVSLMMNWRMIGAQLGTVIGPQRAWIIAMTGLAVTAFATLALWLRPVRTDSARFVVSMTATFAATGAVAWHSHVHTAMIVIPPLIVLYRTQRALLGKILGWWVFLPASLYFVRLVLASMIHAGVIPSQASGFLDFLAGVGSFGLNLYLLGWAIWILRRLPTTSTPPPQA